MTISLIQTYFIGVTTHSSVEITMVGPLFGYVICKMHKTIYRYIYIVQCGVQSCCCCCTM